MTFLLWWHDLEGGGAIVIPCPAFSEVSADSLSLSAVTADTLSLSAVSADDLSPTAVTACSS